MGSKTFPTLLLRPAVLEFREITNNVDGCGSVPTTVSVGLLDALRVARQLLTTTQAAGISLRCIRLLCLEAYSLASARVSSLTLELREATEVQYPLRLVQTGSLQHLRLGMSARERSSSGRFLQRHGTKQMTSIQLNICTRVFILVKTPLGNAWRRHAC